MIITTFNDHRRQLHSNRDSLKLNSLGIEKKGLLKFHYFEFLKGKKVDF